MSVACMSDRALNELAQQPVVARIQSGHKRYPGVVALQDVNFTLRRGEVRALLGKNGAGKSTLIRMLTGSERPDAGQVFIGDRLLEGPDALLTRRAGELGVRAVYQELSLVQDMSVAENLCLGAWPQRAGVINAQSMLAQARHALALLGVDIDPQQWVRDLSPAQQQLVEIARACQGDPKVVILDEPTSSLANAEADLVAAAVMRLSAAGIAVVYVSHRMNEIRRLASSCTIMRDGRVAGDVALDNTSTQQIVDLMLGHQDHHTQTVTAPKGEDKVFEVKQLSLPPKLHQVSFELRRGEVLGIAGLLGAGRSELLKAIVGLTPFVEGELILDGEALICPNYAQMLQRGMAYTPENRKAEGIMPLLGVDENTVMTDSRSVSRFGVLNWQKIKQATSAIVSRMRVKTAETGTPIMTLSGGNQQKVVIGRWVYARSRILLLDEPTRGVDVEAKNQIYRIARELAAEGKSIIFVSSEVEELPQVCDRILLLQQGTIVKELISPVDVEQLMSEVLMIQ